MPEINLTLDSIIIPDITGYDNPYHFGTKVITDLTNKGGLSTREMNNNILTPFKKMRGIIVTEDSYTTEVQYDAKIYINANDNIEFTLGNAQYLGCKVHIINTSNYNQVLLCTSLREENNLILAKSETELLWNGECWININAPNVGKRLYQLPHEKHPKDLYPCTVWEQVNYNGAFFRTFQQGVSEAFIGENDTLVLQNDATSNLHLQFNGDPDLKVTAKDPEWSGSWTGGKHSHSVSFTTTDHAQISSSTIPNGGSGSSLGNKNFSLTYHTKSISGGSLQGDHKHDLTPYGTITSAGTETRPKNLTVRVWQRTA